MMTQDLKVKFKSFVNSRCGLYFKDHDMRSLEEAIQVRQKVSGIQDETAYYDCLTGSSKGEDEIRELLNLLTIKLMYFFRNKPQFKVLKEKALPEIIEKTKIYKNRFREKTCFENNKTRLHSRYCNTC